MGLIFRQGFDSKTQLISLVPDGTELSLSGLVSNFEREGA
jgi:hypothetical protein